MGNQPGGPLATISADRTDEFLWELSVIVYCPVDTVPFVLLPVPPLADVVAICRAQARAMMIASIEPSFSVTIIRIANQP